MQFTNCIYYAHFDYLGYMLCTSSGYFMYPCTVVQNNFKKYNHLGWGLMYTGVITIKLESKVTIIVMVVKQVTSMGVFDNLSFGISGIFQASSSV